LKPDLYSVRGANYNLNKKTLKRKKT